MSVDYRDRPEVPPKPSHRWRGLRNGRPIIISCHGHDSVGLCASCLEEFRGVVADVPYLLDDLDVAIAGDVQFVERGDKDGSHMTPTAWAQMGEKFLEELSDDEVTQLVRNPGRSAVRAHQRLVAALDLAADWFDSCHPEQLALAMARSLDVLAAEPVMVAVARDVSSAAARAHRVIDAPPSLWYYGPCPECGNDLLQERIEKDDEKSLVQCRRCEYKATVLDHNRRILEEGEDRWLTVGELVSAITAGGEVVTRDQINGWAKRHGLQQEQRNRPRYVRGELTMRLVTVYRLGDVREAAVRAEENKAARGARLAFTTKTPSDKAG